jgi:hypothetical protein
MSIMNLAQAILITSCIIMIAGVILIVVWGTNASHPFLAQNILVANEIVKPGESKTSTDLVTVTGPVMYVVIKSDPSNIPLSAIVKDPHGSVMSLSTFSQNLVASFKPLMSGKYGIVLTNHGTSDVKTNIILGYLPLFGDNEKPNYNALGGIFTGVLLLVVGIFGFVAGIVIVIKGLSSELEERILNSSKKQIGRIVESFKSHSRFEV